MPRLASVTRFDPTLWVGGMFGCMAFCSTVVAMTAVKSPQDLSLADAAARAASSVETGSPEPDPTHESTSSTDVRWRHTTQGWKRLSELEPKDAEGHSIASRLPRAVARVHPATWSLMQILVVVLLLLVLDRETRPAAAPSERDLWAPPQSDVGPIDAGATHADAVSGESSDPDSMDHGAVVSGGRD